MTLCYFAFNSYSKVKENISEQFEQTLYGEKFNAHSIIYDSRAEIEKLMNYMDDNRLSKSHILDGKTVTESTYEVLDL